MRFFRVFFSDKYYILSDQVFVSILNFGAVFFLSGILTENIFSQFVLLYVYITLAYTILTAVFSAPILVFATKKWQSTKYSYLFSNIIFLFLCSSLISLIEFFFFKQQNINANLGLFFVVITGMSLADVLKRFMFSTKTAFLIYTPISSAFANLVFFGGMFLYKEQLTIDLILILYGLSYLFSCIFLFISLIIYPESELLNFKSTNTFNYLYNKDIFKTHFRYSRWVLLGSVSFWIYTQGVYIYGSLLNVSDFAIAKTRTIQNLFGIFTILMVAMENYLTPLLVQKSMLEKESIAKATENIYREHFKKTLFFYILIMPIMYGVYAFKYQEIYGNGFVYIMVMWLIQLIAISTKPLAIALKVQEVTYPLFLSHLFAAGAMVVIGFIIVVITKDYGLLVMMLGSYLVANATNYIYYKKEFNL